MTIYDRDEARERLTKESLEFLEEWSMAAEVGFKLRGDDNLRAGLFLRNAWRRASAAGLRKIDFQDQVFEKLKWGHRRRQSFKYDNYRILNMFDLVDDCTMAYYREHPRKAPMRGLEPYLVAVGVAAEACGENPDNCKIELLRSLSISRKKSPTAETEKDATREWENLSLLLNSLCREIACGASLGSVLDAIQRMSCRWEMFDAQLVPSDGNCMIDLESPIHPIYEPGVYFEEMFPFPSVELLLVPYMLGEMEFLLAPEDDLRRYDLDHLGTGEFLRPGMGVHSGGSIGPREHYSIPETTGQVNLPGIVILYRELRLAVVPDGQGGFAGAIETRPRVVVSFSEETDFAGEHVVHAGYEPDVLRGLFYARTDEGGPVLPTISRADGERWRIHYGEDMPIVGGFLLQNPKLETWYFEPDPVGRQGFVETETGYLSYTPVTPDYLRYWLGKNWSIGPCHAQIAWGELDATSSGGDGAESDWVPPLHERSFPRLPIAKAVEHALYSGTLERRLTEVVSDLKRQTARLERAWHAAQDRNIENWIARLKARSEGEF
ncbi:hypothetical protein [Candidatus Halocynthiibacter alkanivorans]|uniref:hypothetical protein n=1 Tax=Candidatus Halocynthiibacter alkanivorans TaxID=2267619 RepID=UPI000DF18D3B|nr:hypothetical protein [Candidatus Halocynthiibacter alkanivorans]